MWCYDFIFLVVADDLFFISNVRLNALFLKNCVMSIGTSLSGMRTSKLRTDFSCEKVADVFFNVRKNDLEAATKLLFF